MRQRVCSPWPDLWCRRRWTAARCLALLPLSVAIRFNLWVAPLTPSMASGAACWRCVCCPLAGTYARQRSPFWRFIAASGIGTLLVAMLPLWGFGYLQQWSGICDAVAILVWIGVGLLAMARWLWWRATRRFIGV